MNIWDPMDERKLGMTFPRTTLWKRDAKGRVIITEIGIS